MAQKFGKWIGLAVGAAVLVGGYVAWTNANSDALPAGIASGNGRIEATEVDIAALMAGRIADIPLSEGDFVEVDQILVQMDTVQLTAQKRQAEAQLERAKIAIETAHSLVRQAEAERNSALAVAQQREAAMVAAEQRRARSEELVKRNAVSQQLLDDDRAAALQAEAALGAAQASVAASDAGITAAKAQVVDAEAAVVAAQAAIDAVSASIDDSTLKSPRAGRVQYLVAQEGEIVPAGGRVLNLVDLN
ncbi:MAG: biotin/lipoyl-binding protein, partial [Cereibacter changlensis]